MIYNKDMTQQDIDEIQEQLCKKYGAGFNKPDGDGMVGIADGIHDRSPINGLRHPVTDNTTGWYIWAGEYSDKKNFFKPMHIEHVIELYPELIPYLGLPPGWRFLIDPANNYEDVWRDDSLLIT